MVRIINLYREKQNPPGFNLGGFFWLAMHALSRCLVKPGVFYFLCTATDHFPLHRGGTVALAFPSMKGRMVQLPSSGTVGLAGSAEDMISRVQQLVRR